ncbi:PepSY domain-containing protein [Marilutibacter spongiae]|uniref:PepSY domain-containing protein n=1 Tax=Marilutibacter spongiae TaxID=2025720 RepID=UPI001C718BA9
MTNFSTPAFTSRIAALSLLAASLAVMGGASAQGASDGRAQAPRNPQHQAPQPPARAHARGSDQRALSEAVRRVERRTGGQVLSAERVPFDGRNVNRIKVVDSRGRVRVYMDDPTSARPMRGQPVPQRDRRTRGDDD